MKDLFDVVCDLDDRADDLTRLGYDDAAEMLRGLSEELKGFIVLSAAQPEAPGCPERPTS